MQGGNEGTVAPSTQAPTSVRDALVERARTKPMAPPRRYPDVDERRVWNPSGMLRRRNLLTRLFCWLFFRKVAFDERQAQTIRDQARDGDVVYVMNHRSILDYLYFNYAFLRLSLPLAFFANRVSTIRFRPLLGALLVGFRRLFGYYNERLEPTERLRMGLERNQAPLLFLKRREIWPWAVAETNDDDSLVVVIESQLERNAAAVAAGQPDRARPIRIVPQLLMWTHNPDRYEKSFWQNVFGDPEAPSRIRKAINFFLNRRRAFVQLGKPVDVAAFIAERPELAGDPKALAAEIRLAIKGALSIEERAIKGPRMKRASRIREEIMATERVQTALTQLASETGQDKKSVEREVRGYVKEIAADFSATYIEVMCIIMTVIFSRIYSEIVVDQVGLEKVREAGGKAPLVVLPCHRSHVDYLVIHYIFYTHGLAPPHIAAGKNLNFFPMGKIFRRTGAFFLRRSFRGNKKYGLAIAEYIRKLVADGYWLEFFIEGGRSRTGKMLPPKFGMLKMVVDAVKDDAADDVQFVPIYVGYEQIIEERSFTRELAGGEKKKENITALLNATQVLWTKYERLYINFGDPISCREVMKRFSETEAAAASDADARLLQRIGYHVVDGINRVAMVTPSSLVSLALLAHQKRGAELEELVRRVGFLLEIAVSKNARLSKTLEHAQKLHRQPIATSREEQAKLETPWLALGDNAPVSKARGAAVRDAVEQVLKRLVKVKHVERYEFDDDGEVFALPAARRANLDFYKNNIVHLFVPEAILAAAIRGTRRRGESTMGRVTEAAAFLSRTLKLEFVFDPDKGFAAQFTETLLRFEEGGLIRREPGESLSDVRIIVTREGRATMAFFHRILSPWVEAYWLLATAVHALGDSSISEKDLVKKAQQTAQRRFHVGDIASPEAASAVTFKHALNACEEFGLLTRRRKGRDKLITAVHRDGSDGSLEEMAERLRVFLN